VIQSGIFLERPESTPNSPFHGGSSRTAMPQLLPFTTSRIYSHFRPETTVPGNTGNVLVAAIIAVRAYKKRRTLVAPLM
jgi:hypothetical protein